MASNTRTALALAGTADTRRTERARRIFLAHNAIERRVGRKLSFASVGVLVAEAEGRTDARGRVRGYTSGNVQRWESGEKSPGIDAMEAMDRLAGFPTGYTAYGVARERVELEAPPVLPVPRAVPRPHQAPASTKHRRA